MMKLISTVILNLLMISNLWAVSQSGTIMLAKENTTTQKNKSKVKVKKEKQTYHQNISIGFNNGLAVSTIDKNDISVSYPYYAYSYSDYNYHYYTANQQAHMASVISDNQYIIGAGIDASLKRNTYFEIDLNAWAPLTGNKITCLSGGGGVSVRSEKNKLELRLGLNFFRLNRKAKLGTIDNKNQDVTINGTTFQHQYYNERKKDTVTVYDLYNASYISVSHNESYYGVQPKFVLAMESYNSPAFVRIHMGWNFPFTHNTYLNFDQNGNRVNTCTTKPVYYPTQMSMNINTSDPYLDYTNSGTSPSYTTGFFFKIEVGIKMCDNK